jgi:hypothetical protein
MDFMANANNNTVEDVAFDCDYTWVATGYAIISYHQKTGEQHFISETNTGIQWLYK